MSIEKMRNLEELARNLHRCADMGDEYSFQYYLDQINKAYKPTYPEMGTRYEHGDWKDIEYRVVHHHHHHCCNTNKKDDIWPGEFHKRNGVTKRDLDRISISVYDGY